VGFWETYARSPTDLAPVLGPQAAKVLETGEGSAIENLFMIIHRHGQDEETGWTYSFSPIQGEDGEFAGVLLLATDMTQQVLSQCVRDGAETARAYAVLQLQELNARLETEICQRTEDRNRLWLLSSDIMLRCTFEGLITVVTPAWTDLLGWQEFELVGRSLFDLIHPEDLDHTLKAVGMSATGHAYSRFDNHYRHKDGTYRWISWSTQPDEQHINPVGRDFTAEHDAAEALAKAEETLRQSQKLEAIGQLTCGVAHDFNNLLTVINFIRADPNQFDTTLVNIALNARDAMQGRGRLTLRDEVVEQLPAVRSHPVITGDYVAISVADTGCEIPPEQLEQIFEPFFTTKDVGKGTGLGLSQVFGFAKQSGGEIVVISEIGQGCTFTLYMPRVVQPPEISNPEEQVVLVPGHSTRVLVVEDNVDVAIFTVQSLTDLGYLPIHANNAQEALVELAKDAGRFEIMFSDVVMPGMSGIELGREIQRLYPDLPVALTSGYSHVLAQSREAEFELLHKPYSVEQLSRLLQKVIALQRLK
jgi:PAS domain S-box-containing protein